jgi:cyclopropane fatty-acyl-phospholipid synthase-like methyltransferase
MHLGYYDEAATNHYAASLRANEALAQWAGITAGARIVDAGCGAGNSSIWLAKKYNARVTGITLLAEQVADARKFATQKGVNDIEFMVANYLEMPFADNTFDVVWALETICYATDKRAFFKEAFRVLKPGGKLVMADGLRASRPLPGENEELLKKVFNAWIVEDLDTVEEHITNITAAGFEELRYKDISKNVWTSCRNLTRQSQRFHWLAWIGFKTGLISKLRYDNVSYSRKQFYLLKNGFTSYGQFTAMKPHNVN